MIYLSKTDEEYRVKIALGIIRFVFCPTLIVYDKRQFPNEKCAQK